MRPLLFFFSLHCSRHVVLPVCCGSNSSSSQFVTLVIFASVKALAAVRAGHRSGVTATAPKLALAQRASVNPPTAWRRQGDVVPRLRLADGARLGTKLRRMAAGKST